MKPLRMRALHRSVVFFAGLALVAGTALAGLLGIALGWLYALREGILEWK